jgi:hypothetical protein
MRQMVFLEGGLDNSGDSRALRFGVVELRPELRSDRATTCVVSKSSKRKVILSPLCWATPTILPKRSCDSDGNDGLALVDL